MATLRANQISADVLTQDINITANTGQLINLNPEISTPQGDITTINSTTGNITTINSTTGNITTINSNTENISTELNVLGQQILKKATNSAVRTTNDWIRVATIPSQGAGTLRISANDGTNYANLVINIANNFAWNDATTLQRRLGFKPIDMKYRGASKVLTFIRVLGSDLADTNPLIIDVQAGVSTTININVVGEIYPDTINDFTVGGFNDDTAGVADYTRVRLIKVLPVGGISIFKQSANRTGLSGVNYAVFETTVRNDLEITPAGAPANTTFPSEEDCIWIISYNVTFSFGGATFVAAWGEITTTTFRYANSSITTTGGGTISRCGTWQYIMTPTDFVRVGMFVGLTYSQDGTFDDRDAFIQITRTYL